MRILLFIFMLAACGPSSKVRRERQERIDQIERDITQHETDALNALNTADLYPEYRIQAFKRAEESAKTATKLRRKLIEMKKQRTAVQKIHPKNSGTAQPARSRSVQNPNPEN